MNLEIIDGEFLSPPRLPFPGKGFDVHKLNESLVVCNHGDRLRRSLKVMPPFSIRLYNCEHFLIPCGIASLLVLKLARIEGNRIPTIGEKLRQNTSKSIS